MINYSIIIPHKNIPYLLRRCLNSIPRREDVQVIVVDDNSNPEIVNFNCFPGSDEPCVEVYFTKKGKGAGYARNVGLEHATGKWILFADADDFFCPCMLEKLDRYKDLDTEVVIFEWQVVTDMLKPSKRGPIPFEITEAAMKGEMSPSLYLSAIGMSWVKMVSHNFLTSHGICFEESIIYNDILYSKMLAVYANRITLAKEVLYTFVNRPTSLGKNLNGYALRSRYDVIKQVNNWLRLIGKPEYEESLVKLEDLTYRASYREYVHLFFRAAYDCMLSAGKAYREQQCLCLHSIRFKFPRLYALYLLLGGYSLKESLQKFRCKMFGENREEIK